jgi:Amt family ammonium transporter
LAASAALLTTVIITGMRFGRPDVSISANGWVGGLVAGSAASPFIAPAAAVFIGLVAGALVTYSVEWFELRLMVDDPGGAISVHAVGGIWGLLALGIFANFRDPVLNVTDAAGGFSAAIAAGGAGQWLAQLVGVATLVGIVLPLSYALNLTLNRFVPFRVHMEGERQGLDLYELGGGAYPEFVTHTEDFTQFRKRKS